jgi:predicted nucleic acid-binding protein
MLVLDTSVILNLLGSGRARFLLGHTPYKVGAPHQVIQEIRREPEIHIEKDASFFDIIESGLLTVVESNFDVERIALALVGAPSPNDLDDGEAYAIAHAVFLNATIGIDERKGRRVISEQWPNLSCLFTVDIIETAVRRGRLTDEEWAEIVFSALHHSRMRVPSDRKADIIKLIGRDRARACPSLGYVPKCS